MKNSLLKTVGALALVATLGACASLPVSRQIPFDEDFVQRDSNWNSNRPGTRGGVTSVVYKPINVDGLLEICGYWSHVGLAGKDFARDVVRSYKVMVNDREVLSSLSFFTKVSSPAASRQAMASCAATGMPFLGEDDVLTLKYRGRSTFRSH